MREIKRFQNLEIILVSLSGSQGQSLALDSPGRVRDYLELAIKKYFSTHYVGIIQTKNNY